jgi:hypothetical protein
MLSICHHLELEESEWKLIHKAFSALSHACMDHAQAVLQLSWQNWTLTAKLCLKSDWSTAESLFHPSMVLYMTNYHLNRLFNNWSWNPADNATTSFAVRICYIIRDLTVTESTGDVCLPIPGYPTLNSGSEYFLCKVSSDCWIKCHNLIMGC